MSLEEQIEVIGMAELTNCILVMNGLREAPSKGKFLNKYVLAQYRFKKL